MILSNSLCSSSLAFHWRSILVFRWRSISEYAKGKDKVFHSFRYTVSNIFKQNEIVEVIAAAVIGHDHDTMTYGNYGDKYSPSKLLKIVELID